MGTAAPDCWVGTKKVRWKLLTALYRVVDAADVQSERAGLPEYQEARADFEARSADFMLEEADFLLSHPPSGLCNWARQTESIWRKLCEQIKQVRNHPDCRAASDALQKTDKCIAARVSDLCGQRAANGLSAEYVYQARALSLLSSAAFKQRQPVHWNKHAGVHAVVFKHEYQNPKHVITPILYVSEKPPEVRGRPVDDKCPRKRAEDALEDIRDELRDCTVKRLLNEAKVVVAGNGPVQDTGEAPPGVLVFRGALAEEPGA